MTTPAMIAIMIIIITEIVIEKIKTPEPLETSLSSNENKIKYYVVIVKQNNCCNLLLKSPHFMLY